MIIADKGNPGNAWHVCGEGEDEDICASCCEHGDTDKNQCLICGKDLTEDLMARADHYKERD